LKIHLVTVQSSKETWLTDFEGLYLKKLKPFCDFEIHNLKSRSQSRSENEQKKIEDSSVILKYIKPTDLVILLDERGLTLDSRGFSKKLLNSIELGKSRIVFVIGGAYGVTEELKSRAHWMLKMSEMVMNHLIIKAVFLEQLYRGFTIIKGIPYHND
jgi:23S rRNA (pseudouridine1915-N3)-methyltransferase